MSGLPDKIQDVHAKFGEYLINGSFAVYLKCRFN